MSFPAGYPGHCVACEERIHEGDQIKYADDCVIHDGCLVLDDHMRPVPETCPKCYMVPSVTGLCGCDE